MDYRSKILVEAIIYSIVITGIILLAFAIFTDAPESPNKFEVVDQYEECKVIRYTDQSNRWHYLFKCP